jgi:di/tricarboxylate transporter
MSLATLQPYIVLALVILVFGTMVTERIRVDVIALSSLSLLLVTGLISPKEGFAVFSNEAPLTVAAMFVLSAALERTGVVETIGTLVARHATSSPLTALLAVTIGAATISAFMNNTPVVVILTPVVIMLSHKMEMSAAKFLIPLSYATVLGGTCSLIGTSTNLVADGAARQLGLAPFGLFEISIVGVPLTIIGIIYMAIFAFRLLPERETFSGLAPGGRRRQFLTEVLVPLGSPLAGKTVEEAGIARKLGARVIDVIRDRISLAEQERVVLQPGDRLVMRTNAGDVLGLRAQSDLVFEVPHEQHALEPIATQNTAIMEGIVGPQSRFVGYRVADLNLRRQFGVYILAIHRQNENLRTNFDQVRLAFGDTILLEGPAEGLKRLFEQGALVSLSELAETPLRRDRAWLALGALTVVILVASFEILPISTMALAASAVVILGGCLTADEAYSAIRWPLLMLIFGSLALGKALETSGGAQLVVDGALHLVQGLNPAVILSVLYLVTMILTEFLSNNATAILLTPIAINLAEGLGVDARPFVVAVMLAASNAYATPVGYQTNTFVYNAGGYKFSDFVRLGLPLNLITWIAASLIIPWAFPLR